MPEQKPQRAPLPPGILPTLTDTDPPPLHPATVILDAYVGVDEAKLTRDERAEVSARRPAPNIYVSPEPETQAHERDHREHGTARRG